MRHDEKRRINYTNTGGVTREEINSIFSEDTVIDLEAVLESKKNWETMYQYLIYFMMYGVSDETMRYRTVCIYKANDSSFAPMQISVIKLAINMIMFYSLMRTDSVDILTNDMVLTEPYGFTSAYIKNWIDEYVIKCEGLEKSEKCIIMDIIYYHVTSISTAFDDIIGLGISIRTFYDIQKQNSQLDTMLHDPIDPTLQPVDIENAITEHVKQICDIIMSTNNEIVPMLKTGKMLSLAQLSELTVGVGFKSDLDGNTIPIPALNNFLITGINNAIDKFIDSVGGRKAAINSKIGISVPGATSKKMNANATDYTLRKDNVMCNSTTLLPFEIKDEQYLEGMDGHYYYDDDNNLQCLDKGDTHLIGKTLRFRSAITCSCEDGEICRYCYPKRLINANENLASIGSYAAIVIGEPLGQMMLSSKHSNKTNSGIIEFPEQFYEDFELVLSDICVKSADTNAVYINVGNIFKNDYDEDCEYLCSSFDVLDKNMNILYTVSDKNGANMFLIDQLDTLIRSKRPKDRTNLLIDIMDLDSDRPLFMVEVASAQKSDTAKLIRRLIGTKSKCGCKTYSDLLEKLIEAYLSAGIKMNFAHFEVIVKSLLRKASDIYAFPDFSPSGNPMDYQILSLNDALYASMSPMVCFRTSNLKKQLIEASLYSEKKTKPSHLDAFFAETPADVMPPEYCE